MEVYEILVDKSRWNSLCHWLNCIVVQSKEIKNKPYIFATMEYREMDTWKVNEFNFLNEEAEEFTSRWSQNLVNVRSPMYLKQKTLNIVYEV